MKSLRVLCALTALASSVAFAQSESDVSASEPVVSRGQGWSMQGGKTLGDNTTAVGVAAGWPGLSVSLLHGATPKIDVGARFSFNYGFEGLVNYVVPGFKLQGMVRLALLDRQRFNLALEFAPGPLFYFGGTPVTYGTTVGLALPFNFVLGIPVGSAILLNAALDFPLFVNFGYSGGLYFPVLMGGGAEYFIDRDLAATFKLRMGPTIDTNDYRRRGNPAYFTLEAMIGIEYRL